MGSRNEEIPYVSRYSEPSQPVTPVSPLR